MITCGSASRPSLLWPRWAVAALAQRCVEPAHELLALLVGLIDFEVGGGGVVEDQVDVEPEQVGGLQEDVALDLLAVDREHVEGAVELVDGEPLGLRQPGDVGQPARGAGELRGGIVKPLRRHGEEGGLVRRGQAGTGEARADRLADAEFLPEPARRQHDAEFEDGLDVDLRQRGRATGGERVSGIDIEDAVDAGDEALKGGVVELVGAAEAVHDAGLGAPGLGVPEVLGEGVVGNGGTVAVSPLGDPQVHAQTIQVERRAFKLRC